MPSLTATLEDAIHRAIGFANARRHELATLEHLLLALIDDLDASLRGRAAFFLRESLRALREGISRKVTSPAISENTASAW